MAVIQASAEIQSDIVWEIDRSASHGEVSTRHWFWGRHAGALEFIDGHITMHRNRWKKLHLVMRSPARDGASVKIECDASRFRRDDHGRFTVTGEFRIDGVSCDVELRLHDLGMSGVARRFATIAADMTMPSAGRRIWRRAYTGHHLTIFVHTEWVTRIDAVSSSW